MTKEGNIPLQWTRVVLVPERLRLRATLGRPGAQAAGILYQQRSHAKLAFMAARGRSFALGHHIGRRCAPPVERFSELCHLVGIDPRGAAAMFSRGYPTRVSGRVTLAIVGSGASVVVKVGNLQDAGIATEAAFLRALDGKAGTASVPRVRWYGAWNDQLVLASEALDLDRTPREATLEEAAATATALSAGRAGARRMVHGDLSPWNLLRTVSGLGIVDWEGARYEFEPLFDLAHFAVIRGGLLHRATPQAVITSLTAPGSPGWRHLTAVGVDPRTAPDRLGDYLENTWDNMEDNWNYRREMLRFLGKAPNHEHLIPGGTESSSELIPTAPDAHG